ncbi:MAG: AMP-dependent synthetase [Betaproteobacteria bacterium]|nr:AMP-dependent synthetase [Betaproteobacteria bacterium]
MAYNLAELLLRNARLYPARPALAVGARVVVDYAGFADRVQRLGGALVGLGLQPGARVAVVAGNCTPYIELMFAAWHAGLAIVPVHSKLHPKELAYIFENSGAAAVFGNGGTMARVGEAARLVGLAHVFEIGTPAFEALYEAAPAAMSARGSDDLAWLFYTSGTTGRPKGVMLSHANLMQMVLHYAADVDAIAPEDCIVHAAPLSHGSGLYVLPHVAQGACNVVTESGGFDPGEIFALWRAHKGVTMFAAPTMIKRLVDSPLEGDPANLKTIVYGGGPMYPSNLARALERFGPHFVEIYGQGESPMTITAKAKALHQEMGHPRYLEQMRSAGRAFAGLEVMIADENDQPLPAGTSGEICVRGAVVMRGYWRNPEASAKTLRHGWLHTGDIGVLDEEGFLTLKDRSKDLIISGGSNIYPREVEEALLLHPAVSEVSVVGRPHPEWGEEVVAFIVARAGGDASPSALDAHCLEHIARFKRPKEYRLLEALPKNEAGKVLKTALREMLMPVGYID